MRAQSDLRTTRVSVDTDGVEAAGLAFAPSISADGRFVAFDSSADNLVAGDANAVSDIFVHDRQIAATERISVDSFAAEANGPSVRPQISADGRFVAFTSTSSNLVAGDTNATRDVFVYDRQTGTTQRVSVDSSGSQGTDPRPNIANRDISISADGRFVAFKSTATNLVAGDTNDAVDVFVHDRATGMTERVSVDSYGTQGNGSSHDPSITADGRFVAFESSATNLVPNDTNGAADVFVRDRHTGTTERASVTSFDAQAIAGGSDTPSFSADGRFLAFVSTATNLVPDDTNNTRDAFVRDRQTGVTQRVSIDSSGAQANGGTGKVRISANGRFVALRSDASNLVVGDTNEAEDVFVHDRRTGTTDRLSITESGAEANASSILGSISADGRFVAFDSNASNLVDGDTNGVSDVFVRDALVDQDGDQIFDSVDSQPTIVSAEFNDVAFGGLTEGTLVTRGDQTFLSVLDSPLAAPNDGILVATGPDQGPGPARIQACSGLSQVVVDIFTDSRVLITCGSFTAHVRTGTAGISFSVAGEAATASLAAGTALSYDASTNELSAPTDSTAAIVVVIGGSAVSVAPGTTTNVGDTTAPTISAVATTAPNVAGWYSNNVVIQFTCADAGAGIPAGACPADQTLIVEGITVASTAQTVTDAAGNTSEASNIVTVKIDKTAPVLSPIVSPNPVLLYGTATVISGASDPLAGLASEGCSAADTTSVGARTVNCTATDNAGNVGSASASYQVIYAWTGFFQPVDDLPVFNQSKAGAAIPVKFGLGGNRGLSVLAAGYPLSRLIACNSGAPLDDIEQTVTAGGSSLIYDPATGHYTYVWKTDKIWANTCRQFVLKLVDGTEHLANFKLK